MAYSGIGSGKDPTSPRPPIVRSIGTERNPWRTNGASPDASSCRDGEKAGSIWPEAVPRDQDNLELQEVLDPPGTLSTVANEIASGISRCTEGAYTPRAKENEGGEGISEASSNFWSLKNELLHCEVARLRNRLSLYARGRLVQEVLRIVGELGDWADPEPFESALWQAIEGDERRALLLRLSAADSAFLRELRDDSAGWILLTEQTHVPTFVDLDAWAAIYPEQAQRAPSHRAPANQIPVRLHSNR